VKAEEVEVVVVVGRGSKRREQFTRDINPFGLVSFKDKNKNRRGKTLSLKMADQETETNLFGFIIIERVTNQNKPTFLSKIGEASSAAFSKKPATAE
jgi:hypothetical protein